MICFVRRAWGEVSTDLKIDDFYLSLLITRALAEPARISLNCQSISHVLVVNLTEPADREDAFHRQRRFVYVEPCDVNKFEKIK